MTILARACGHTRLDQLCRDDLVTWKEDRAKLSGVAYGGVGLSCALPMDKSRPIAMMAPCSSAYRM